LNIKQKTEKNKKIMSNENDTDYFVGDKKRKLPETLTHYPDKKYWLSPNDLQITAQSLKDWVEACKYAKLQKWWCTAGTLLGQQRHGGAIPWDDDVDVSMMLDELDTFLTRVKPFLESRGYFIFLKRSIGYQIYPPNSLRPPERPSAGVLDVFIVDLHEPSNEYTYVMPILKRNNEKTFYCGRKLWPKESISPELLFPIQTNAKFEDFGNVHIPARPVEYLQKAFSPTVMTFAPSYPKKHSVQHEKVVLLLQYIADVFNPISPSLKPTNMNYIPESVKIQGIFILIVIGLLLFLLFFFIVWKIQKFHVKNQRIRKNIGNSHVKIKSRK